MKKKYVKPEFSTYKIFIEEGLAQSSNSIKTGDADSTPNIDDFEEDVKENNWEFNP